MKGVQDHEVLVDVDDLPYEVFQKLLVFLQEPGKGFAKPPAPPLPLAKSGHCCCQQCYDDASKALGSAPRSGKKPAAGPVKAARNQLSLDLANEFLKHIPAGRFSSLLPL